MAEPINLAPIRVHAISVSVQPPPNSIVGPAEMLLQQGENGGVQIDAFWLDAMGNEMHESKEMQEEEYEALRKDYLRTEQATLPPFSSFKSGNTIGRVVGETAPAAVPASQANPPIAAETEEEGITGEQVLDGIQLGLDVVGLIPVVGEVADIASGVISLARGDYVGAGLSLLSAIPFVGYAGTAGKAARYGAKMTEASGKAAREVIPKRPPSAPLAKRPRVQNQEPPKGGKDGGKSKGGPCNHLRKGNGKGPYRGGAHNQTSKPANDNKDSHHMPADDASPLPKRDGPAIQMHPDDHRLTKSNGSVKGSAKYRQSIQELIDTGEWRKAMTKEIKDVRRIQKMIGESGKYNEAILEMLKYFRCLEKNNLLP